MCHFHFTIEDIKASGLWISSWFKAQPSLITALWAIPSVGVIIIMSSMQRDISINVEHLPAAHSVLKHVWPTDEILQNNSNRFVKRVLRNIAGLTAWKPIDPDLFLEEHTQKMLAILRLHTRYHNGSSLFSPGDDISLWLCSGSFPVSTFIFHRRGSSISDVHCQWNSFTQGPCLYYIFSEKTIFSEYFFSSLCKYSGYPAMHHKYNYGICQQELSDCVQLAVCVFALGLHNPKCLYQR